MSQKFKTISVSTIVLLILASITVAIFNPFQKDSVKKTFALDVPDYAEMQKNSATADQIIMAHHEFMNNYFNYKIELVQKKDIVEQLTAQMTEKAKINCQTESISTFCVADSGSKALDAFIKILQTYQSGDNETQEDSSSIQSRIFLLAGEDQNKISLEMNNAINAFELSLDLYDQYLRSYQLHKEYEKIIKSLEKYKKNLEIIRKASDFLPSEFLNVTTDKCT